MIKPLLLLFCFLPLVEDLHAQQFRVTGKVTNASLEPLSYVSVAVKGLTIGTTTKADGSFELLLTENRYEFVFTMIGYRQQVVEIVVRNNDVKQNVILETVGVDLNEVEVKAVKRDRAEEIIRNVIRNKEKLLEDASSYSTELYIRATQENDVVRKKKKRSAAPLPDSAVLELQRMSMAEITLNLDYQYPNKIKEERTGVKVRGNSESLFYLSATEGDFSFYRNLVKVPALSEMPFLSPISFSGLIGYRFKTVSIRKVGERKIFTIRITPVKLGNALVEGEVEVLDSAWVLLRTHFEFPKFHMPEYDYFSVDQQYEYVDNKAWLVTRQEFAYAAKAGKSRMNGRTIAQYSKYRIAPQFAPKHFGNEVSATSQQAYERDTSFWSQVRTEPLTEKEVRFIRYKDSVFTAHNSREYLDSVDKVFNRVTWKKILLLGQGMYRRDLERTIYLGPLASMYEPFNFGGGRIGVNGNYTKTYKSRKNIVLWANLNYGIRNKDLKGNIWLTRMYNPFNRGYYAIDIGREFSPIFEGDAWINQLRRSNVFEHNQFKISHGVELKNGLFLINELQFGMRRSVENYKTNSRWDSLTDGILVNNQAVAFPGYNAFYNSITLRYTPAQQYIREPREKVILGSVWPTFYVNWRKGLPGVFKSVVNFDYLEFGAEQQLKLGLAGISRYKISSGSFYNTKDLRLVDYKWMRQGDPILFSNPTNTFQLLDSTFPAFRRFYEAHYLHHFNGAILNKIPLFKKFNLMEVAGGGILYLPERNLRYIEGFVGVEKVLRFWTERFKVGVYVVGSVANQYNNPFTFKLSIEHFNKRKNSWY
ncbi:MAG: carboxypeptidase-like regulatory domain-containing protein [Chitinophagaceae bacterium]|nr:MAG: carboxypeptidase-like regulatory domain-containing protein [Chitinophagaceae bacterium]